MLLLVVPCISCCKLYWLLSERASFFNPVDFNSSDPNDQGNENPAYYFNSYAADLGFSKTLMTSTFRGCKQIINSYPKLNYSSMIDDPIRDKEYNATNSIVLTNPYRCFLRWQLTSGDNIPANAFASLTFDSWGLDIPACRYRIRQPRWSTRPEVLIPGFVIPRKGFHCSTPSSRSADSNNVFFEVLIVESQLKLKLSIDQMEYSDGLLPVQQNEMKSPEVAASLSIHNTGRKDLVEKMEFTKSVTTSHQIVLRDTYDWSSSESSSHRVSAGTSVSIESGGLFSWFAKAKSTFDFNYSHDWASSETSGATHEKDCSTSDAQTETISHSSEIVAGPGENLIATAYLFSVNNKKLTFTATMKATDIRGRNGKAIRDHLIGDGFKNIITEVGSDFIKYEVKGYMIVNTYLGIYIDVHPVGNLMLMNRTVERLSRGPLTFDIKGL